MLFWARVSSNGVVTFREAVVDLFLVRAYVKGRYGFIFTVDGFLAPHGVTFGIFKDNCLKLLYFREDNSFHVWNLKSLIAVLILAQDLISWARSLTGYIIEYISENFDLLVSVIIYLRLMLPIGQFWLFLLYDVAVGLSFGLSLVDDILHFLHFDGLEL